MKKLWISFAIVLAVSFAVLGWIGTRIYQEMPPIPEQVIATDGTVVIPSGDVGRGQNVWQSLGGMEMGGHVGLGFSDGGHDGSQPQRAGAGYRCALHGHAQEYLAPQRA